MIKKALSFKDVLLVPKYSNIETRSSINTEITMYNNEDKYTFSNPLIVANMKTLIGSQMLLENTKSKSLCYMHRFVSIEEQLNTLRYIKYAEPDAYKYIGASIGVKEIDKENLKTFYKEGVRHICIDIAHGDSKLCVDMIKYVKSTYPDIMLCAGNIATYTGAMNLWNAGANIVKVGIGSGSICSTRIETGNGVPQLHAIMEVTKAKSNIGGNRYFISDGGCSTAGDVSKALCFADMVMAGNMFAGSIDCPASFVYKDGQELRAYHGSSTHKNTNVEGYLGSVKEKSEYKILLDKIMQGVKSCCAYQGVNNLNDLKENPEFVEITHAGIIESGAHDIIL